MRIAITGTTGRVGAALLTHFSRDHEVIALPRSILDLDSSASITGVLDQLACDVFLNPAGITSLEECEDSPEKAMQVNASAPGQIARWASDRGTKLLHFSTDYVFSGDDVALLTESDTAVPLSSYGRSKLAGENEVLAYPGHCVIRVSWVFGPEKGSFIDKIFEEAISGHPLAACDDKFSLPTSTVDLAAWTRRLITNNTSGMVHACQSGEPASWHDMAAVTVSEMVAVGALESAPLIQPLKLKEMTSFRAARPRFTAMDTSRLASILGQPPRDWKEAVEEYIRWRHSLVQGE